MRWIRLLYKMRTPNLPSAGSHVKLISFFHRHSSQQVSRLLARDVINFSARLAYEKFRFIIQKSRARMCSFQMHVVEQVLKGCSERVRRIRLRTLIYLFSPASSITIFFSRCWLSLFSMCVHLTLGWVADKKEARFTCLRPITDTPFEAPRVF
jgi:hypothetical protein